MVSKRGHASKRRVTFIPLPEGPSEAEQVEQELNDRLDSLASEQLTRGQQ